MILINILFVIEKLEPDVGMAYTYWSIAKKLAKSNKIFIITSFSKGKKKHEIIDGIEIFRPLHYGDLYHPFKQIIFIIKLYFYLIRFLAKNDIDLIHSSAYTVTLPSTYAASYYKIPVITSIRSFLGEKWFNMQKTNKAIIYYITERLILKFSRYNLVHFPSKYTRDKLQRFINSKSVVIYNFIEKKQIMEIKNKSNVWNIRKKIGIKSNETFILFVGRFSPAKNIPNLINVLGKTKVKFKLILVGYGDELKKIKKSIENNNLENKCIIIGKKSHRETLQIMNSCDFLILPSMIEQFPKVVIEALAFNKPVIATKVGGIPEINSDNLYLVDNLEEINKILQSDIKPKADNKILEEYSLDKIANEFEKIYKKLV